MATYRKVNPQSKAEIRTYYIDFANDLPTGVTVTTATATHTPPSGTPLTPTVAVVGSIVAVTLAQLSVTGVHKLSVVANLSNGDKSDYLIDIPVDW